jgi:hypothetical protein
MIAKPTAHLDALEVRSGQYRIDLLFQERADQRRRVDVDDVDLRLVELVLGQDRIEEGRLCGAWLHRQPLADQVSRRLDSGTFDRDDREAVGLQYGSNDLDRCALRADLHRRRRIGKPDVGVSGRDQLSGRCRPLAFLDRQIDADVLVVAELLGQHESCLRTSGEEIERQFHRFELLRCGRRACDPGKDRDRHGNEYFLHHHLLRALGIGKTCNGQSPRSHGMHRRSSNCTA